MKAFHKEFLVREGFGAETSILSSQIQPSYELLDITVHTVLRNITY